MNLSEASVVIDTIRRWQAEHMGVTPPAVPPNVAREALAAYRASIHRPTEVEALRRFLSCLGEAAQDRRFRGLAIDELTEEELRGLAVLLVDDRADAELRVARAEAVLHDLVLDLSGRRTPFVPPE